MLRIFVVGKFTGTSYGPFDSEPKAQEFIRHSLGSSTRYYETVAANVPASTAVAPWVAQRADGVRAAKRPADHTLGDRVAADASCRHGMRGHSCRGIRA